MENTLIATIRANDQEDGEIIEISFDGKNIVLSNGDDPELTGAKSLQQAAEWVHASWKMWNTYTVFSGNYDKDTFSSMIDDWKADNAPEYDDLEVDAPELDDNGKWIAAARDNGSEYTLSDDGAGNISINYAGSR